MGYAEDWNRTSDTSIFSAVLYQLSYLGTRIRVGRTLIITRAPYLIFIVADVSKRLKSV